MTYYTFRRWWGISVAFLQSYTDDIRDQVFPGWYFRSRLTRDRVTKGMVIFDTASVATQI